MLGVLDHFDRYSSDSCWLRLSRWHYLRNLLLHLQEKEDCRWARSCVDALATTTVNATTTPVHATTTPVRATTAHLHSEGILTLAS